MDQEVFVEVLQRKEACSDDVKTPYNKTKICICPRGLVHQPWTSPLGKMQVLGPF